jgi:hypothetical protein
MAYRDAHVNAMASVDLPPYPRELSAAPGNKLSTLDPDALIEAHGPQLVLAGRFPEGIVYTIAPTEIVNFGVCGRCLVLADPDTLDAFGVYSDPDDAKVFAGEEQVLVCAPPLDGTHAFILADLAWREARILETTVAGLESLMVVLSWTPERAEAATNELFTRYEQEARRWWACTQDVEVAHPRARWSIYTGADASEFSDNLTRGIQKFARAPSTLLHRALPDPDARRLAGLAKIAAYAVSHEDEAVARRVYRVLLSHPETILGILTPTCFDSPVPGIEEVASEALGHVFREEVLTVAAHEETRENTSALEVKISLDAKFVFGLPAAYNFAARALGKADALHSPEAARANLDAYVGGYLGDLDLTRSFITGSAAMSSVLRHPRYGMFASHTDFLESYYPATYTAMAPDSVRRMRHLGDHHAWYIGSPPPFTFEDSAPEAGPLEEGKEEVALRSFKDMVWYPGTPREERLPFEVVAGADVDIAIAAEGARFDEIAHAHYAVIKLRFPSALLVRVDRERSHMYRVVSAEKPGVEKGFREVEMYPASWAEICTHHVGMVRLAYTAARADETGALPEEPAPEFYLTASCLKAAAEWSTPNYYFFASRKTTPQEIMLKYAARGYPPLCLPPTIQRAIRKYAQQTPEWNPTNRYWIGSWDTFTGASLSRDGVGKFNVQNYMVETRAFGYEEPAPAQEAEAEAEADA